MTGDTCIDVSSLEDLVFGNTESCDIDDCDREAQWIFVVDSQCDCAPYMRWPQCTPCRNKSEQTFEENEGTAWCSDCHKQLWLIRIEKRNT